jgi:hypothetical protein
MPLTSDPANPARRPHSPTTLRVDRLTPTGSSAEPRTEARERPEPPIPSGVPARTTGRAAARVTGTPLADGVTWAGNKLMVDGFSVLDRADRRRSGGRLLVAAAARLAKSNGVKKLSASARATLAGPLLTLLKKAGVGRDSMHHVAARSGAFALLEQLVKEMRGRGETTIAKNVSLALFAAAAAETHVGLRLHMQRHLLVLPERCVPREERASLALLEASLGHERPLRDKWITGDPPTLKASVSVQGEFWKDDLTAWRKAGYTVSEDDGRATAKRVVNDVDPPVTISLDLRRRDENVLDGLGDFDTDVVLYTGHAQLGGVAKQSLTNGPAAAKGEKLVAFLACATKQAANAIERLYPGQHILVSDQATYGHDDTIVAQTLLDGIARGRSYAQIEAECEEEGLWVPGNYVFPHEANALLDLPPVYLPTERSNGRLAVSMRPKATDAMAAELPGGAVKDAVDWLNTSVGYWAEGAGISDEKAFKHKLRSAAFFDSDADQPVVRVTTGERGTLQISVNKRYAHQNPDALAMMVTFEAVQLILERADPRMDAHQRKMTALAVVAEYVYYLVEFSDMADVLLKQFGRVYGFAKLDWSLAERAVAGDHDASEAMVKILETGLA